MSTQAAVTQLRIGSAKYTCTDESKLKEGIPRHSDEHPTLGKEAAISFNLGDVLVMRGTAQQQLQHKTLANHEITREKLAPPPRATGKDEPAEIATPPALSMAARSAEIIVNMYASNTADRIPWHSDGQPLFGEEAFAAYPTDP